MVRAARGSASSKRGNGAGGAAILNEGGALHTFVGSRDACRTCCPFMQQLMVGWQTVLQTPGRQLQTLQPVQPATSHVGPDTTVKACMTQSLIQLHMSVEEQPFLGFRV